VVDTPLVSILINNYNYAQFLRAAIDSALAQTYPNVEVIVVDDGSTDNSREVIAGYGDRIIPVLKENGGQASAFNAGFAVSTGDIICFLDSDDIFLPQKVEEVVKVFDTYHDDIGWFFHRLELVNVNTGMSIETNKMMPSDVCDFRHDSKRGKSFTPIPATSGLCFTRTLLENILPMPDAIQITSDNYLKQVALALSKGFLTNKRLAIQYIHENNAYTLRNDKRFLKARIAVLTAYWIRSRFPQFEKLANNGFAFGIANYQQSGGIETDYQKLIQEYWSATPLLAKLNIKLRIFYHRIKFFVT